MYLSRHIEIASPILTSTRLPLTSGNSHKLHQEPSKWDYPNEKTVLSHTGIVKKSQHILKIKTAVLLVKSQVNKWQEKTQSHMLTQKLSKVQRNDPKVHLSISCQIKCNLANIQTREKKSLFTPCTQNSLYCSRYPMTWSTVICPETAAPSRRSSSSASSLSPCISLNANLVERLDEWQCSCHSLCSLVCVLLFWFPSWSGLVHIAVCLASCLFVFPVKLTSCSCFTPGFV